MARRLRLSLSCNLTDASVRPRHTLDSCDECTPGTSQLYSGREFCMPAPTGRYVDLPGQARDKACLPGSYQDMEGQVRGHTLLMLRKTLHKNPRVHPRSVKRCSSFPLLHLPEIKTECKPCAKFYYQELYGQPSCKHSCAWLDRFCFPCSTCMPRNACQKGNFSRLIYGQLVLEELCSDAYSVC